jgi:hypothetical protein
LFAKGYNVEKVLLKKENLFIGLQRIEAIGRLATLYI